MAKSIAYIVAFLAISVYFLFIKKKNDLPAAYDGKFLPEFRTVAELFREQVVSGKEIGGNFAVYYKGKLVVDLWGGYADKESQQKWRNDTLPITFSTTKGIVSILAARMVEQNLFDYKRLVSDYWPGFGSNGKENVTVDMLMSHVGGLSYLNKPISLLELHHNPEKTEKVLEKENPKWPPGSAMAYHSMTFGAYIDRLLTKADPKKRRIDQLFKEEIAKPLDIDFHIGLPKSEAYRAARFGHFGASDFMLACLTEPSMWNLLLKMFMDPEQRAMKSSASVIEQISNDPLLREIGISSVNGHGTAEAMAKLYGILANGGKHGKKQFLSQKTLEAFTSPKNLGISLDFGQEVLMGRGVFYYKNPKEELVYGHSGYGGQMAYADPVNNIGIAYLTNDLSVYGFGNDPKFKALEKEFYACLDRITKSDLSLNYETFSS